MDDHKGWSNRGYLPHFDDARTQQFITFRLGDAVPRQVLDVYQEKLTSARQAGNHLDCAKIQNVLDRYMDQGYGACYFKQPELASVVEKALQFFHGERYELIAWTIMPNHVHVLITEYEGFSLSSVVQSWKSYTSKQVNKLLGRRGTLWQREYYDRYIRDLNHFFKVLYYIDFNPVKAGLVAKPEDWQFGSARLNATDENRLK